MKLRNLALVTVLSLYLGTLAEYSISAVKIGQKAPEFSVKGHDGKTYSLSKLKGKYVVLEWFNDECPYVKKHYHDEKKNMQSLQKKWIETASRDKEGLLWFSVVSSAKGKQGYMEPSMAKTIKKKRSAHMSSILLDYSGKLGRLYSAKTTPHMYIIDPKGILRYDGAIDNKPSTNTTDLAGAKNFVDLALNNLVTGKPVKPSKTKPYGCSVKY